jgi:hypothetical protein
METLQNKKTKQKEDELLQSLVFIKAELSTSVPQGIRREKEAEGAE